jgi:preprotein translocase subunit SecG
MVNVLYYVAVPAFIVICLILIGLILLQKGRGGGLSSAFGGAGGNTAFGSKTGDILTWATAIIFGIFILLAIGLNLLADSKNAKIQKRPATQPVPAAVPMDEPLPADAAMPPVTPAAADAPVAPEAAPVAPEAAPAVPAAPAQ